MTEQPPDEAGEQAALDAAEQAIAEIEAAQAELDRLTAEAAAAKAAFEAEPGPDNHTASVVLAQQVENAREVRDALGRKHADILAAATRVRKARRLRELEPQLMPAADFVAATVDDFVGALEEHRDILRALYLEMVGRVRERERLADQIYRNGGELEDTPTPDTIMQRVTEAVRTRLGPQSGDQSLMPTLAVWDASGTGRIMKSEIRIVLGREVAR